MADGICDAPARSDAAASLPPLNGTTTASFHRSARCGVGQKAERVKNVWWWRAGGRRGGRLPVHLGAQKKYEDALHGARENELGVEKKRGSGEGAGKVVQSDCGAGEDKHKSNSEERGSPSQIERKRGQERRNREEAHETKEGACRGGGMGVARSRGPPSGRSVAGSARRDETVPSRVVEERRQGWVRCGAAWASGLEGGPASIASGSRESAASSAKHTK